MYNLRCYTHFYVDKILRTLVTSSNPWLGNNRHLTSTVHFGFPEDRKGIIIYYPVMGDNVRFKEFGTHSPESL